MSTEHFDVVVIGSGPAGQKAAIAAAKLGKRVAMIDRRARIGGVSLHTGTIPSKTLREAVLYLTGYRQRAFYGRDFKLKEEISVADLAERVNTVIARESAVIREQLGRNGITLIDGTARFTGPHTLEVEGGQRTQTVEAEHVLIACGTRAARPAEIPFGEEVMDADQLGQATRIPRDFIVVGAGVIGLEYASMLAALGIKVTVIDQRPAILDFVDREIVETLNYHLRRQDAVFRLGEKVTTVGINLQGQVQVELESGKRLRAEGLLYAAGRQVNTDLLDLAAAGLEADERGRIAVNEHFQSAVGHIYAAGDCIGFPSLAATSMEQGRLAAGHMFGQPTASRPSLLPYGIYTIPEISCVGLSEEDAKARGDFFRSQLEQFLLMTREEHLDPLTPLGSYAGAMGMPQFMPSSVAKYAIDFDGDGRIDLNGSAADVIGSVANYFKGFNWRPGMPTHYPVRFDPARLDLDALLAPDILPTFSVESFTAKGAVLEGGALAHQGPLALVELQNGDAPPSYVAGTENFYVVTRYNWSSYYAMAVIELGREVATAMAAANASAAR